MRERKYVEVRATTGYLSDVIENSLDAHRSQGFTETSVQYSTTHETKYDKILPVSSALITFDRDLDNLHAD